LRRPLLCPAELRAHAYDLDRLASRHFPDEIARSRSPARAQETTPVAASQSTPARAGGNPRRALAVLVTMRKSLRLGFFLVLAVGSSLGGCSSQPLPGLGSPGRCGNPCAAMACPSAFRCDVDGAVHRPLRARVAGASPA